MNIVLTGFKNCGKTSVGKCIAKKLKTLFIDTDTLIEQRYFLEENTPWTVRQIFQYKGARFFRDLEKKAIHSLEEHHPKVIATGGGSLLGPANVSYLKKHGLFIYLSASFETLQKRLGPELSSAFLGPSRELIYKKTADMEIYTEDKSIAEIADEVLFSLRRAGNGK